MYPRISDLINDLLGTDFVFPANTFGFFVALAFLAAYQVLRWDMKQREALGQFPMRRRLVIVSAPVELKDVIIQAGLWGLIGYKIGYGILNWEVFSTNPAEILMNAKGSFIFLLLGVGIFGGYRYWQYRKTKDDKVVREMQEIGPSEYLGTVLTIAFIAGIAGAKVFHHLEYWQEFLRDPTGQFLTFNGLTFYGGLLTAGVLIIRFLYKKGFNILHLVDVFAPCLILAYAIGRVGCQMAGDGDWGIANPDPVPEALSFLPDWLWSFNYPNNVNAEGIPIQPSDGLPCIEGYCTKLGTPVFPTPVYETTMGLIIFGFLMFLRKRLPYIGQMTGIYLFLNGLERNLIEKIRVNAIYHIGSMEITQAEIISFVLMLSGIGIFAYATFKLKLPPKPESHKRAKEVIEAEEKEIAAAK